MIRRVEPEGRPDLEEAADAFGPETRWEKARRYLGDVRVIYTDMDGTMLGPEGNFFVNVRREFTLEPARAMIEAMNRGVDIVLSSGRSRGQLRENARMLGIKNYIAELGVELVYDHGERVIVNAGALSDRGDDLYRAIMRTGAVDFLLTRYPNRLEYHTPWSNFRDCTPLFRGLLPLSEVNDLLERYFPGLVLVDNGVLPLVSDTLDVPEMRAYHLMPMGVSKEKAAAEDMDLRGLDRKQAIAIGDSEADLAFASVVGVFFLMRNGLFLNPGLLSLLPGCDNVVVTRGFLNEGWAEAVKMAVLGG